LKISDYENPFTGKESNLFDIGKLFSLLLGVVVLILVFVFGQRIVDYFVPVKQATTGQVQDERIVL
jgi:hypothetical protein